MSQSNYYTSITDLPLSRFIDCLVDENLYALVISGEPKREELENAWTDILLDWNHYMMDEEGKFHFNLLKECESLKLDLKKVEICLTILEAEIKYPELFAPEKEYADTLNALVESNFKFDHSNPEDFKAELKRAKVRANFLKLKVMTKQASLDAISDKDNKKIEKLTKEYFQTILNTLSIGITNFQLTDSISVYSFCDWVKKYNLKQKFLEEQSRKK